MKKRKGIDQWNKWFTENYDKLCEIGKTYHREGDDLVHHVYLRVQRQRDMEKIMINPLPYFKRAMFVEATRGKFKREYFYSDIEDYKLDFERPSSSHATNHLDLENIELLIDRLSWFDKTVFHIWIDGYNMCEVARESGIPQQVFHTSLFRSKNKIRDAISRK